MTADDEVNASAIRIVIADDHAVVRSVLHTLLDAEENVRVVAEADDLEGARHALRDHDANVLILGAVVPGGSSLEAIATIHAELPDMRIVVLTSTDEPATARRALRAGAAACVLREAADSELVETVRRITGLDRARPAPPDDLSAREVEVLRLIALGHTNTEIARQLYLSVRTVETHRSHIQQKLRVSTRAELVRHALQTGLIADERQGLPR